MPYFYQEDEGHHFNRLVEMVKNGDFNPHYFNKPSLHFYLRMPAIAGSFLWSARANEIESIQDIVTRDDAVSAGTLGPPPTPGSSSGRGQSVPSSAC